MSSRPQRTFTILHTALDTKLALKRGIGIGRYGQLRSRVADLQLDLYMVVYRFAWCEVTRLASSPHLHTDETFNGVNVDGENIASKFDRKHAKVNLRTKCCAGLFLLRSYP